MTFVDEHEKIPGEIAKLEKEMRQAARDLEFEQAAELRDRIRALRARLIALPE